MKCQNCIWHDHLYENVDGELVFDGCMCNNNKAELENMHSKCCEEYGGNNDCPYGEIL